MSSVIPFWDKSLSLSRLRNAGEESGFYGAVEGWIPPATPSGSIGGRTPLPTVRSEGLRSPAFRKVGWLVRFDGWCNSTSSVTNRTTYEGNLAIFASNSEVNICMIRFICLLLP